MYIIDVSERSLRRVDWKLGATRFGIEEMRSGWISGGSGGTLVQRSYDDPTETTELDLGLEVDGISAGGDYVFVSERIGSLDYRGHLYQWGEANETFSLSISMPDEAMIPQSGNSIALVRRESVDKIDVAGRLYSFRVPLDAEGGLSGGSFSPNGDRFAVFAASGLYQEFPGHAYVFDWTKGDYEVLRGIEIQGESWRLHAANQEGNTFVLVGSREDGEGLMLVDASGHSTWETITDVERSSSIAFHTSAEALILGTEGGDLIIRLLTEQGLSGSEENKIDDHEDSILEIVASQSSEVIVSRSSNKIIIWRAELNYPFLRRVRELAISAESVAVSADGRTLGIGLRNGVVAALDVATGAMRTSKIFEGPVRAISIHPNDQTIIAASPPFLRHWQVNESGTSDIFNVLDGEFGHVNGIAHTPDGSLYAVTGARATYIYSTTGNALLFETEDSGFVTHNLAFSLNGNEIFSFGWGGGGKARERSSQFSSVT